MSRKLSKICRLSKPTTTTSLADATTASTFTGEVTTSDENDQRVFRQQKARLEEGLVQIARLKTSIEWTMDTEAMNALQSEVDVLVDQVYRETALPLPPLGLSLSDYQAAIGTFARLPFGTRLVYCEALKDPPPDPNKGDSNEDDDYDDAWIAASDFQRIPSIVSAIYVNRDQLTATRIRNAVLTAKERKGRRIGGIAATASAVTCPPKNDTLPRIRVRSLFSTDDSLADDDDDKLSVEEKFNEGFVRQLLPQVTRLEGRVVTEADLSVALAAIRGGGNHNNVTCFVVTATEAIPGGFVLRGQNRCPSGAELVAALDDRLPQHSTTSWSGSLSFVPDCTTRATDSIGYGETADPVLLLLNRDMSPRANPLLTAVLSAAALITALLFAVGVYGGNDLVMARLVQGPTTISDFSSVDWYFSVKILDVLVPVLAIQAAHEVGHWTVAFRDKIQTAPPTFLPFWQLPWLGAQTKLKESPQNLTSLFDFAMAGPILGLLTSSVFLFVGLQQTAVASAEAIKYFPALPVSMLKLSTLGGTVVDNVLTGGTGFLEFADPATAVPLHPMAIAGFTGLMIQSFELLPLGATDGGRLSLALFGRMGHSVIGGLVWAGLLVASIFVEHTDLLVLAWIVYNFVQNDPEIPSRDEVTKVDLVRGAAALALWFAVALILTPMTI